MDKIIQKKIQILSLKKVNKLLQNFLQIMEDMDINALVQKHNVIDTIVNVIDQAFIVLIAIAKIVIINHLRITYQIDIKL